jgi:hypothetical protein
MSLGSSARLLLPAVLLAGACTQDQDILAFSPEIVVSPASLDFGEVVVTTSQQGWIEIINDGRATLRITDIAFGADSGAVFTKGADSLEVPAGDRVPLQVVCTPTTYADYGGTLVLATNDGTRPIVEIPLACAGVYAPTPDLDLDPMTLDFGTVDPGDRATLWASLSNVGDADLHVGSTTQAGSGAFVLASDPEDDTLGPGEEVLLVFTYEPATILGDHGQFLLLSDDPDEPAVTLTLLGNGGGDFEYPVAVIEGPTTSVPLETIQLDGSGSTDPSGYELTYDWSLERRPEGSTAEIAGSGDRVSLFLDLAGTFQVNLSVVNEVGIRSTPAEHTIEVVPTDDVHVEMFWDASNSDLDLHLLQAGTALFAEPGDCTWCNPNPDWGEAGDAADDPTLDLDDRSGYGPENVNIESPADDAFEMWVHYFEDNGAGAVTATVRVYLEGAEDFEASEVLERDQRWFVGTILWPEAVVSENETEPLVEGGRRNCYTP